MNLVEYAENIIGKGFVIDHNSTIVIIDKESKIKHIKTYGRDIESRLSIGTKLSDLDSATPSIQAIMSGNTNVGRTLFKKSGHHLVGASLPIWNGNQIEGAISISSFDKDSPIKTRNIKNLIGQTQSIRRIMELVVKVSQIDCSVLVTGESGVGKELIAESIHFISPRRSGPFICINCAAIPENLLESELFGYESGAFTGASKNGKPGKIELAHKGTLFLDEVGEMDPSLQAKLLRVLQEKVIERVGGKGTIPVDFRIVAATNKDLYELVREGKFREDLYYRLNVIPIEVPPLRSRKTDILLLCDYFIEQSNFPYKKLSSDALELILNYDWPGNIRQLKNVIEYATIMANDIIYPSDLPKLPQRSKTDNEGNLFQEMKGRTLKDIQKYVEEQALLLTLKSTNFNKTEASKQLGISRQALYTKAKEHGIHLQ